jgi:hypothetical protein
MNSRSAALIAGSPVGVGGFGGVGGVDRRALAGDQLYVDLDLSVANLPPGTRLRLGSAVVEITDSLHAGCAKFSARYGVDAFRFVNSPIGRALRLRGVNTRVIEAGVVRRGDSVTKVAVPARVGLPATAEVGPPAAPEAGLPAAGVARQRSS